MSCILFLLIKFIDRPIQPNSSIARPKSVLNPPKRRRRIYYPEARSVTPIDTSSDKIPNDSLINSPITTSPSETDTPSSPSQYCYHDDNSEKYIYPIYLFFK